MYFLKKKQKIILDLREEFILTRSTHLCVSATSNAAPHKVVNAVYISNIGNLNRRQKLHAIRAAIRFIWKSPPMEAGE